MNDSYKFIFKLVKEKINLMKGEASDEMRGEIANFVDYCNSKRNHEALGRRESIMEKRGKLKKALFLKKVERVTYF